MFICTNITNRQIEWVNEGEIVSLPAYRIAAKHASYKGHISKDRSRYMHTPGAQRVISADIK